MLSSSSIFVLFVIFQALAGDKLHFKRIPWHYYDFINSAGFMPSHNVHFAFVVAAATPFCWKTLAGNQAQREV